MAVKNKIKSSSGANPIAGTIESVSGYPTKLKIFQVECSRFYWARVYINGIYKVRSLKTESRKEAIEKAKQFYEDCLVNRRLGIDEVPRVDSFITVGEMVMDSLKAGSNYRLYLDFNSRFKKELVPFFGKTDISLIRHLDIDLFMRKLLDRKLSPATVSNYFIVLKRIMKYAFDNHIINQIPEFPKIHGKTTIVTRRDYFEKEELDRLIVAVEELAEKRALVRGVEIGLEIKYLIRFMVGSFIRPSDLRVLKHKHVKVMVNENQPDVSLQKYLLLSHPATKTTDQEVVTMPDSYYAYQDLLKHQGVRGYADPDDYLFLPQYENRTTMIRTLGRLFAGVVAKAGVGSKDELHTLYSLRHSAIMFRLMMGNVNTLKLARNARTSQLMIEKFYASRLTNLMGVDELHGL
jgi:integrase